VPTARFANSLGANEVVENVIAGSQFEFLGRPSRVQVYSVSDLADVISLEVFFGQELQASPAPLPRVTDGTGPTVPDDLIVDDVGAPGDRLVLRLTETLGNAGSLARTMIVITPVA
jgi:hypothetical protein